MLDGLIPLLILMSIALLWRAAARAREQVILSCRRVCRELGLQLLDETVVLHRLRLRRNTQGRMSLERHYNFEFSASGQERCEGWARAIGESVEQISLDHPEGRLIVSGKASVSYSLLDRLHSGEQTDSEQEHIG